MFIHVAAAAFVGTIVAVAMPPAAGQRLKPMYVETVLGLGCETHVHPAVGVGATLCLANGFDTRVLSASTARRKHKRLPSLSCSNKFDCLAFGKENKEPVCSAERPRDRSAAPHPPPSLSYAGCSMAIWAISLAQDRTYVLGTDRTLVIDRLGSGDRMHEASDLTRCTRNLQPRRLLFYGRTDVSTRGDLVKFDSKSTDENRSVGVSFIKVSREGDACFLG